MDTLEDNDPRVIASGIASQAVASALVNQRLPPEEAAKLYQAIHAVALVSITSTAAAIPEPEPVEQPTAQQIKKSITPEGLVSFIDGKPYKTLKRHLTSHGLTPETYRERYGLPADYPTTAPNYSAARSALAKKLGLGRPGAQAEKQAEAA